MSCPLASVATFSEGAAFVFICGSELAQAFRFIARVADATRRPHHIKAENHG